jgi:glycerol-3-phosphate O-acyltransferase
VTEHLELDDPAAVAAALDALVDHKVVTRWDGGTETVYAVGVDQHLAAAFYRNTIVHFFTSGAIAEVALLGSADAADPTGTFWSEVAAMRDLLKFEFFFAEKDEFRSEVAAEVAYHDPDWERRLAAGDAIRVLGRFRPFASHRVLRPVFEAYLLVADALVARDFRTDVDAKRLVAETLALGGQYRAQLRIKSPEAVSTALFESAIRLAGNRGLLAGGGVERLQEREAFAAEIREVVDRIERVEGMARP